MSYGGGAGGYPSVFTPPSYPSMETWQRPESSAPPMNEVLTHAQPTPGMNYSAPWQPNMGTHDSTPFDHTAPRWPAPFTPEPPSYSHPSYPPPSYQQSSDHRQSEYQQGNYGYEVPYSPPVPSIPSNAYAANRESEYGNAVTHRAAAGSYGNEQVVAYHGGSEPYGARGTGSGDYWESPAQTESTGRVSSGTSNQNGGAVNSAALTSQGAQRYTVRLLPDNEATGTQKEMVCQIALDGVKLLEKGSSRVLRVYPLETITCWAVKEPSVFTFWARSAVDVELRAVRLQSSEYTTTSILDALTACCVQLFEMVGKDGQGAGGGMGSAAGGGGGEGGGGGGGKQLPLFEWMAAKAKTATQEEEKDHWVPDTAKNKCSGCHSEFNYVNRKHHCRNCGDIFCDKCSKGRSPLTAESGVLPVRVCDHCLAEVTQRLSRASVQSAGGGSKAGNLPPQRTHEDLAKKLQEEMERNGSSSFRRSSTSTQASLQSCGRCGTVAVTGTPGGKCAVCGYDANAKGGESSKSNMQQWGERGGGGVPTQAGPAMREVVCPTCTVHLHVQVPTSGMETVECGVCRQPFLVEA